MFVSLAYALISPPFNSTRPYGDDVELKRLRQRRRGRLQRPEEPHSKRFDTFSTYVATPSPAYIQAFFASDPPMRDLSATVLDASGSLRVAIMRMCLWGRAAVEIPRWVEEARDAEGMTGAAEEISRETEQVREGEEVERGAWKLGTGLWGFCRVM